MKKTGKHYRLDNLHKVEDVLPMMMIGWMGGEVHPNTSERHSPMLLNDWLKIANKQYLSRMMSK